MAPSAVVRVSPNVGVIGASGYTGIELTRLLARHPTLRLAVASSERWVGEAVAARGGGASDVRYAAVDDAMARASELALVFLATPAELSHQLAPRLVAAGTRVIDLSGAFRLRDAAIYPARYGFAHAHASLLADAVYGLPERDRERIAGARLVANPGCYATAIVLALAPIVHAVAPGRRVFVSAGSGVSGAGRSATEDKSFVEVYGDARAYRVLRHQHDPEIEQATSARIAFVPHLLPIARGILATCCIERAPGVAARAIDDALATAYGREPFVELARSAEDVGLRDVVGTNRCRIGVAHGDDATTIIVAAIDNLVKGAAGQAIQNANLMLGLDETAGLADLAPHHP
jgi:N-acetyl-gamma-glutamyl-phosphate reductase